MVEHNTQASLIGENLTSGSMHTCCKQCEQTPVSSPSCAGFNIHHPSANDQNRHQTEPNSKLMMPVVALKPSCLHHIRPACLVTSSSYLKTRISKIYWCNLSMHVCVKAQDTVLLCGSWHNGNRLLRSSPSHLSRTRGMWGLRVSAATACRHEAPGPAITVR